jgi:NADH:ubiquinone reductase (H+-translocating)
MHGSRDDLGMRQAGLERVLIVGAGFGGVAAARALAGTPFAVTLIDENNFHTFQPLLYQLATAGLDPADVAFPVRAMFTKAPNVTFRHGRVQRCDLEDRSVTLEDGTVLAYDRLVVATGAAATFFAIAGAAEHALPLYTLDDARRLRNRVLSVLEAAEAHPERFRDGAPAFVIIGGGPTGVEIAGALVELLDVMVDKERLGIDRARTSVVLLDATERLLGAFGTGSSEYARRTLVARGVQVRFGSKVERVELDGVVLGDGSHVPADVVIWGAGVTVAGTLAATLGPAGPGGRAVVNERCALVDHPEVFVIGDAAAVPLGDGSGATAPQLAQVAIQSGRYVAARICDPPGAVVAPFRYRDKGIMATIGRGSAVAELTGPGPLRGRSISGFAGWLAWLGLHLVYLVGGLNRLVVFVNWFWRYLGWTAGPRIIVEDPPPRPDEPGDS